MLISNGAAINFGSLVASSLDIKNEDFQKGNLYFIGNSDGKVINQGEINSVGSTVLIGSGEVSNVGNIRVNNGNAHLIAGSDVTLSFPAMGKMAVKINHGSFNALINNGIIVIIKNGIIVLTAWATDKLIRGVINNTGVLESSAISYQLSAISYQLSAISYQLSASR